MIKKILNKTAGGFWALWGNRLSNNFRQRNDAARTLEARMDDPIYLERYGYKVYSQNDEDGIIAEIFNRIGVTNRTFVEFGVQNGLESNTHFLLHKGWRGLWIEGSPKACTLIRKLFAEPVSDGRLSVVNALVDKDNINALISNGGEGGGIYGPIDLLSIDIDGNDYWVWEAITCVEPRVVVIEYNPKFPPDFEWVMAYDKNHVWKRDDIHGASLKSYELLGRKLGYQLVGTNVRGLNAFFVRREIAGDMFAKPAAAENLYNPSRLNIHYVSGHPPARFTG